MKLGRMMYRGTIVVNIDGVLANFEQKFCQDFGSDNRDLYSLEARYPNIDPEIIKEYVLNPQNYEDLSPIFGGILFTVQAKMAGWYVLLATSRDKSLREVTLKWLSHYNVHYNEIIFAKYKPSAIRDWERWNQDKPVRVVVDDSVSVLQQLPDKYCVAWDSLWNADYYPRMWYSNLRMKVMLEISDGESVGAWDKVGKK